MAELRVGVLDSGIAGSLAAAVVAGSAFAVAGDGGVEAAAVAPDRFGHGSAVAAIVLARAPAARLLNAQIFGPRGGTSAEVAAAGLAWLAGEGADIVTMSFGLRADREVLREEVAAAAGGRALLGAAPARGAPVFPSSYPGVLRITGDARCAAGEISHLATVQADFGACVRAPEDVAQVAGASLAVAHAAALVAAHFLAAGARGEAAARAYLAAIAHYHGAERKTGAD